MKTQRTLISSARRIGCVGQKPIPCSVADWTSPARSSGGPDGRPSFGRRGGCEAQLRCQWKRSDRVRPKYQKPFRNPTTDTQKYQ